MLKTLYEDLDKAPASAPGTAATPAAPAPIPIGELGRSRDNPAPATFLSRRLLNKDGSEKETWHIEFDLSGCGLDYEVGDTLAFSPATSSAMSIRSSRCLAPRTRRKCAGGRFVKS